MTTDACTGLTMRRAWIDRLLAIARPVLDAAERGRLRAEMPVEAQPGQQAERARFTHLEAVGRLLAGLAPWLEHDHGDAAERARRASARRQALALIAGAVDPASPDRCNFTEGQQPVVDAAFLAHALLRAPTALAAALPAASRGHLVAALRATRAIAPYHNNWLLFAALVEAALHRLGEPWDGMRADYAVRQHQAWYAGDGHYGDGPEFHADFYNAFVIQPMLLDLLATLPDPYQGAWSAVRSVATARAMRYAAVQERMIAGDGGFPPIGRSLAYRCGAFQHLAQAALQGLLPAELPPAQVRCALDAVIRRTLDASGTFDRGGWLAIGLCGHQPALGEVYISTGSLYLCSTAFLPLGLAPEHAFWSGPDRPWTAARAWSGEDLPADAALKGR